MKRLWMISLLFVALSASAQITLVKKGKAKARIVLAEDNETNRFLCCIHLSGGHFFRTFAATK